MSRSSILPPLSKTEMTLLVLRASCPHSNLNSASWYLLGPVSVVAGRESVGNVRKKRFSGDRIVRKINRARQRTRRARRSRWRPARPQTALFIADDKVTCSACKCRLPIKFIRILFHIRFNVDVLPPVYRFAIVNYSVRLSPIRVVRPKKKNPFAYRGGYF